MRNSKKISFTVLLIIASMVITYFIKNENIFLYFKENTENSVANLYGLDFKALLSLSQYLIFLIFYQAIDFLREESIFLLFSSSVIALLILKDIIICVRNFHINRQKNFNNDYESSISKQ